MASKHRTSEEKNGHIRICVEFWNLNKAHSKDEFPLRNMDMIIDSTSDHWLLSFMDGFGAYNQIKMALKDVETISLSIYYLF